VHPNIPYRNPTAWLGMSDSNSETSSQIIPLKARADFPIRAEFRPWRPLAFELQGREYAARGTSSAFSCVEIRAMPDESIAHENHHRARAQREEGLRARLRERGKTTGQTPFGLLGLANLDTRHKHQSESVWCEAHHVRNPIAIRGGAFLPQYLARFSRTWQPLLKPWFGISLDGIDGTFRFGNAPVDAFGRMDHEHVLALVEADHGAHGHAINGFAANAAFVDYESQFSSQNTIERATLAKKADRTLNKSELGLGGCGTQRPVSIGRNRHENADG
jgi:hypothetical protein